MTAMSTSPKARTLPTLKKVINAELGAHGYVASYKRIAVEFTVPAGVKRHGVVYKRATTGTLYGNVLTVTHNGVEVLNHPEAMLKPGNVNSMVEAWLSQEAAKFS